MSGPDPAAPVPVARFGRDLPAMVADLEELVTCESPSADPAALARSAAVAGAQGARLLGVEADRIVLGGRTHLRWRLGTRPPRVLLLGHHDTVWPIGSLATLPWSTEGGVARGPGCFDMKAGLVLIFHALRALGVPDGVTVLVSADEEIGSPTAAALIEEEASACDAVLVTEPSADGGALKIARKGVTHYELEIRGRAAHAGLEPERGVNATMEAARQVLAVAALADPAAGTTVTPTLLNAGTAVNTVPEHARLSVDARVAYVEEQERVDAGLRALVPSLPEARLTLTTTTRIPPMEAAASSALFRRARQVAAVLGIAEPDGVAVGGGSDGNRTAALGVPTLDGLGAVGGGAHAAGEHVILAELPGRAALLAGLVASILAGTGQPAPISDS